MQCPICKARIGVRDTDDFDSFVIRVRRCPVCRCRVSTAEVITEYQPAEQIQQRVAEIQKTV